MRTFLTLLQKELVEAWRDRKLIWLPIVIIILAISQPISLYYMPQILEHAGNLPEGTVIDIPTPTGEEALTSTLSQFGLVGTAIFILSVMGSIVHERNSGALSLVMARPVKAIQYIGSKWVAHVIILLSSFGLGYGLAYYYTNLLFNKVPFDQFVGSFLIYSLWILFIIIITLLAGTLLKKVGAVAGASLVIVCGISLGHSLFPKFMTWSPAQAQVEASDWLLTGSGGDSFGWMLVSTLFLIILLFFLTVYVFKKEESYQ